MSEIKLLNPQIKLSPEQWLNDFAWWGMRYCIGRKSGASLMCYDILEVLETQKECFEDKKIKERLKFFARDIRAEISQRMNWLKGVICRGDSNSQIVTDAYTLLVKYLEDNPEIKFEENDFDIDCAAEIVSSVPSSQLKDITYDTFPSSDFHGWIKLANYIDRQKKITVGNGEKEEIAICVEIPTVEDYSEGRVAMVWSPIYPLSSTNRYYLPEYIKKIEDI